VKLEQVPKYISLIAIAIVTAPEIFYEQTHELEVLWVRESLLKKSIMIAKNLLDFVLPEIAKLSKHYQN